MPNFGFPVRMHITDDWPYHIQHHKPQRNTCPIRSRCAVWIAIVNHTISSQRPRASVQCECIIATYRRIVCFSSTTRSVLWMGKNGMRRAQTTTYAINTHLIRDFAFHYQIIRAIHAALCSGVASSSPCACVEVKEFICITYTTSVVYSTPRGGSATQMTCVCVFMCVNVFNTIKYSHNARVANLHDANGRGGFARRRKSNVSRTGTSFTCSAIRHSLRSIHLRVCVCVCVCVPSKRLPGTDREYIYANMHVLAVAHTVTHAQWACGVRSCVVQEFIVVAKQKTYALVRTCANTAHARLFVIYHFHYHGSGCVQGRMQKGGVIQNNEWYRFQFVFGRFLLFSKSVLHLRSNTTYYTLQNGITTQKYIGPEYYTCSLKYCNWNPGYYICSFWSIWILILILKMF